MRFKDMRYLFLAPDGNYYIGRAWKTDGTAWVECAMVADEHPLHLLIPGRKAPELIPLPNMLVSSVVQAWEYP